MYPYKLLSLDLLIYFLVSSSGYVVRCIIMDTPMELAFHMNMYRQSLSEGSIRRVPEVAYNIYKKKYEAPSLDEGFETIEKVQFVPKFKSDKERTLFLHKTDMKWVHPPTIH